MLSDSAKVMAMPQPTGWSRSVARRGRSRVLPAALSRATNSPRHAHPDNASATASTVEVTVPANEIATMAPATSARRTAGIGRVSMSASAGVLASSGCTAAASASPCRANAQKAKRHRPAVANAPPMSGPHSAAAVHTTERQATMRGHEPVGKEPVLGDVDQRDQRAAAEALHGAPGEQHRHRRGGRADDAAEGVRERRGHHGPAQTEARHAYADDRRGDDRAHQVQREGPAYEPQPADVFHRLRHRGGGQHRVGGVQPDRQTQREELRQIPALQDLAPADVLPRRGIGRAISRAFGPIPADVVRHGRDGRKRVRCTCGRARSVDRNPGAWHNRDGRKRARRPACGRAEPVDRGQGAWHDRT